MQHRMSVVPLSGLLLADTRSRPPGQGPFIRPPNHMCHSMLPQALVPPLSASTFSGASASLPPTFEYQSRSCLLFVLLHLSFIPAHSWPSLLMTQTHSLDSEMEWMTPSVRNPNMSMNMQLYPSFPLFHLPPSQFYSNPQCPSLIRQDADPANTVHHAPHTWPQTPQVVHTAIGRRALIQVDITTLVDHQAETQSTGRGTC